MKRLIQVWVVVCAGAFIAVTAGPRIMAHSDETLQLIAPNGAGLVRTINVNGRLDLDDPFSQDLGTNGRSCFSCHRPAEGWTITSQSVQRRFMESQGLDPIFRTNDGSNCLDADVSTL